MTMSDTDRVMREYRDAYDEWILASKALGDAKRLCNAARERLDAAVAAMKEASHQ